ncbi:MAG TPA: PQQ-dependent sugar dehydrogenase [Bryobacteraceae bacterium]|nr:PQQ-dependent sugar dehydrogenase [Bryobacteraceae bacterium]
MEHYRWIALTGAIGIASALLLYAAKSDGMNVMTGPKAFTNTASLSPGLARKITAQDLPPPRPPSMLPRLRMYAGFARGAARRGNAIPKAPAGFKVDLYVASGLTNPRQMRRAPNGDIFVADTGGGTVRIFRGMTADGKPQESSVYASFPSAFGINFYPPGPNPQWVYVTNTSTLVRYAYKNGDVKATGEPEKLITDIPARGGHSTRDIVFSKDGKSLFLAVGSASNSNDDEAEFHRANILEYTPEGKFVGIYASGIRNPVGLAINPETGELWTSVNERDNLGDDLVPDYVTHVARGGFYGWPWFYIGGYQDPAHAGKHPELKQKVIVPDVLIQAHSASLGMAFYDGKMFPAGYSGDAFAAEHGSWNHSQGSGREVIRIPIEKGRATGVYQDFLTGFTTDGNAWGRPVGVAVAADGSLLVTDDGARVIWRVSYAGQ